MAATKRAESKVEGTLPPKLQPGSETERVQIVAPVTWIKRVQEWRRRQPNLPSQSEAIRLLVEQALAADDQR